MDNYTTTTLAGLVTTPASVTEYSLDASAPFPTVFKIDATYDPTSENAQSGVAVAEALKTVVIPVDLTYSSTSENAQSGVAVQKAFAANNLHTTGNSTVVGLQAGTNNKTYCTCCGHKASSNAWFGTSLGYGAWTSECSVAIGVHVHTNGTAGFSLGYNIDTKKTGIGAFAVQNNRDLNSEAHLATRLFIIGAGTPLATQYEGGAACLGYEVVDGLGNIVECGTRKLSELLTNNTLAASASMDLDAPVPTPFVSGATSPVTDPIDIPEELTPTDQPTE